MDRTSEIRAHPLPKRNSSMAHFRDEIIALAEEKVTALSTAQHRANIWPQVRIVIVINVIAISMGMAMGFSGVALPALRDDPVINATADESSLIASVTAFSTLPGALIGGWTTDNWGRKRALIFGALPDFLGWVLISGAHNVNVILIGRSLIGINLGLAAAATQVYISEISEVHLKGALGATITFSVMCGILMVYVLGGTVEWRMMCAVCSGVPFVFLFLMCFLPETPSFLLGRGKIRAAENSLKKLRASDFDISPELYTLKEHHRIRRASNIRWKKKICSRGVLRPFLVMLSLFLTQEFSGSSVIVFYSVDIFKSLSKKLNPYTITVVLGALRIVFTLVAVILLRFVGIRPLTIISGIGMSICLSTVGTFAYFNDNITNAGYNIGWIPGTAVILYMGFFSIGYLIIPWVLLGEVFPSHSRGMWSSLMTCIASLLLAIAVKSYQHIMDLTGIHGAFWCYGVFAALGTFAAAVFLPETKGKSLPEIEEFFSKPCHFHICWKH